LFSRGVRGWLERHIKCLQKTSNKVNRPGEVEQLKDGNNVLKSWQNAKWGSTGSRGEIPSGWDTFYATS